MRNQANVEFRQPGTKLIVWHHAGQAHVGVSSDLQDRRVGVGVTDQYNLAVAEAISHARQQLDVYLGLEVAGIADGLARVALECVELSTGSRTGPGWIAVAAVGNESDIRAEAVHRLLHRLAVRHSMSAQERKVAKIGRAHV